MKTLKNKLDTAQKEYEIAKKNYLKNIEDLKKTYMERQHYRDEKSPLIIKGELNLMRMSYDYLNGECKKYDFDSEVRRADKWKSEEILNYYQIWDEKFKEQWGSTPCSYILHKKHLKQLPEHFFIEAWKHKVNKEKYKLGYEKFVKSISITDLAETLNDCLLGFYILNEPKLKIKNIVIILPK